MLNRLKKKVDKQLYDDALDKIKRLENEINDLYIENKNLRSVLDFDERAKHIRYSIASGDPSWGDTYLTEWIEVDGKKYSKVIKYFPDDAPWPQEYKAKALMDIISSNDIKR